MGPAVTSSPACSAFLLPFLPVQLLSEQDETSPCAQEPGRRKGRRARICLCRTKWVKTRYVPQKSSLCCDVKLLRCTGTLGGLWSKKDRRDCSVEAFLGGEQVEDRVTLGENTVLS